MAWTAKDTEALDLLVKVVKGNELTSLVVETHNVQEFQTSLANGKDLNKAVMVANQLAVLGVRKDYFLIELPFLGNLGATAVTTHGKNGFYVDLVEFTSVPPEVQYDIFGEFSPFVTPRIAVDEDMIEGIDRQEMGFTLSKGWSAFDSATANTWLSQKIRGVDDSRIQSRYDDTGNDPTLQDGIAQLKIKPLDDGVFLIPEGAIIWADPGVSAHAGS